MTLVLRRIKIPFDIRLDGLHEVLQAAMGWTNSHLYEICAGGVGWGLAHPDWPDGPLHARKARLDRVVEVTGAKSLRYLYDFGDGWEHTIKIERLVDRVFGERYPRLLEANGRCPPEDVGGPSGYAEALKAIHDPRPERHDECKEWMLEHFDPAIANIEWLADELTILARRWSRKPARRTKSN